MYLQRSNDRQANGAILNQFSNNSAKSNETLNKLLNFVYKPFQKVSPFKKPYKELCFTIPYMGYEKSVSVKIKADHILMEMEKNYNINHGMPKFIFDD
jgi:hypothetical protein